MMDEQGLINRLFNYSCELLKAFTWKIEEKHFCGHSENKNIIEQVFFALFLFPFLL